ncbi:hypothetical protein FOZ63_030342, partial [Perkinsus olseni]
MVLKRGASDEAGNRNKRKRKDDEEEDDDVSSSSSGEEEGENLDESGSGSDSDDSSSSSGSDADEGDQDQNKGEEEASRSPGKSPSKVTAMGFENDGFVVDDEDNEGSDGDNSSDSRGMGSSSEDEASDLDPDDIDDGDLLIVKETNPEAYARIMARKAAAGKAGEANADTGAAAGAEGASSSAGGAADDDSDDDSLLGGRKKGFSRLKKQKDFTKAQHITATSADALEDRLFDDDDFADGLAADQGRSPAARRDRRDEDSDNDSLADFIVREAGDAGRDDDDDDLPNRGREYAERYGEDMAGLLQEIDEVFGDARVLNLAAGRTSAIQQQQEEDRDVEMAEGAAADPEKDLEARFDPEEVAARFVTAKDQAIARANIPERYQAVYGPNAAARCIAAFKAVPAAVGAEGVALDPAEAESAAKAATDKEMYNQEWSVEAKWIYAKIRERADIFANPDAYSTTPSSYSQIFADDSYKFQIIPLIEVLLRDVKGRGYEIPTIWNGMLRCKYRPVLDEQDLWTIMDFDRQWIDIKRVKQNMAEKLQGYKDSLQRALDIDNEMMEQATTEHAEKEAMSPQLRDRVVKANSQITMLLSRLDDLSSSQIDETYAETLRDVTLMISVQVEPKLRRLQSTGLESLAIVHKSHLRVDDSLYRVITDAGLDRALEEVIGMDPQQLGESLLVGHNFAPAVIDRPSLSDWVHAQCQGKSGLIFHNEKRLVDALAQFMARNIASDIGTRRFFRRVLWRRAHVCTMPVGAFKPSATSPDYLVSRLCMKPICSCIGPTWSRICALEAQGSITVDIVWADYEDPDKIVVDTFTEAQMSANYSLIFKAIQALENNKPVPAGNHGALMRYCRLGLLLHQWTQSRRANAGAMVSEAVEPTTLLGEDCYLRRLVDMYAVRQDDWREFVLGAARQAVQSIYISMRKEIRARMKRESDRLIAESCAAALGNIIGRRPYEPSTEADSADTNEEDAAAAAGMMTMMTRHTAVWTMKLKYFRASAVVMEKVQNGTRCHLVTADVDGTLLDVTQLDWLVAPKSAEDRHKADMKKFEEKVSRYVPAVVVVCAMDIRCRGLMRDLSDSCSWLVSTHPVLKQSKAVLPSPQVVWGDPTIPRIVAMRSNKAEKDGLTFLQRLGLSMCRFMQDPLAETVQLWSDEPSGHSALQDIPLDPCQANCDRFILREALSHEIIRRVNQVGVDLNVCARSPHRSGVLKFVAGLGPRKANILLRRSDVVVRGLEREDVSEAWKGLSPRQARLRQLLGDVVWQNCQPFMRLSPDMEKLLQAVAAGKRKSFKKNRHRGKTDMDWENSEFDEARGVLCAVHGEDVTFEEVLAAVSNPHPFELTRLARDTWPVAKEACRIAWHSSGAADAADEKSMLSLIKKRMCLPSTMQDFDAVSANLESLVDAMLSSADLPEQYTDREVDKGALKSEMVGYIKQDIASEIHSPYYNYASRWEPPTAQAVFEACTGETSQSLGKNTVVQCEVIDGSFNDKVKVRLLQNRCDGFFFKWDKRNNEIENAKGTWNQGDLLTARVTHIKPDVFKVDVTVEDITDYEQREIIDQDPRLVAKSEDFRELRGLGKVVATQKQGLDAAASIRGRRIIRHDNYKEISHSAAMAYLESPSIPIGEVLFRPSTSHQGHYICMIKIKQGNRANSDWVKQFVFQEAKSKFTQQAAQQNTLGNAKMVYKLPGEPEEFDELDQIKAMIVEPYMKYLTDFTNFEKYQGGNVEQVKNLVVATKLSSTSKHVAYFLTLDERKPMGGAAVLLWAGKRDQSGKYAVIEEPVHITHRGFKLWNAGPFKSVNRLIQWWKQEGFFNRKQYVKEYRDIAKKHQAALKAQRGAPQVAEDQNGADHKNDNQNDNWKDWKGSAQSWYQTGDKWNSSGSSWTKNDSWGNSWGNNSHGSGSWGNAGGDSGGWKYGYQSWDQGNSGNSGNWRQQENSYGGKSYWSGGNDSGWTKDEWGQWKRTESLAELGPVVFKLSGAEAAFMVCFKTARTGRDDAFWRRP